MTITGPTVKILHVAKGRFGWDADGCRQVLVRIAGVTTSKDLGQAGFETVMGFAARCGFQPLGKGAARHGELFPAWFDPQVLARVARAKGMRRRGWREGGEIPQGFRHAVPYAGRRAWRLLCSGRDLTRAAKDRGAG